jgi:hypothetical protein
MGQENLVPLSAGMLSPRASLTTHAKGDGMNC